jgi:hypothetical protein
MEKWEDSPVLIETGIKNRFDAVAGPIDHILLGVLVQFVCKNRGRTSHEHCSSFSLKAVLISKRSGEMKDIVFAEKFTRRTRGFESDSVFHESRVQEKGQREAISIAF